MANNYFGIYVNPPHTLMLQIQLFRNKTFFSLFVCRCGWKLGHHRSPFFLYQSFNRKWHTIISNYFHLNNPQNRTGGLGCFVHIRGKVFTMLCMSKISCYEKWKIIYFCNSRERNPFFALDRKANPIYGSCYSKMEKTANGPLWSTTCATLDRLCIKCNKK